MSAQQSNFYVQSSHRFINSNKKDDFEIQNQLDEIKKSKNKVLESDDIKEFFFDNVSNDIDQILNNKNIEEEEEKDNDLFNFFNKSTNSNSGMSIHTTSNSKEDYY